MSRHAGEFNSHVSPDVARGIMGRKNFFGASDAVQHMDLSPSEAQLTRTEKVPFSEETLERCRDTHFLFVYFSQSIEFLRKRSETQLPSVILSFDQPQRFYREIGDHGWQLIRKTAIPRSHYRNWRGGLQLVGKGLAVPFAQVVVYMTIAHHCVARERLFGDEMVRTLSVDDAGFHVRVGLFERNSILVEGGNDDHVGAHIGIAEKVMPSR